MTRTEVSLSAIPDRMVNNSECKSKIILSLKEKGKPVADTWIHIATTGGRLYGLDMEAEKSKERDVELVKVKTDKGGQANMGLDLPDRIGPVHLAAGKKKKDVVEAVERAMKKNPKMPKGVALATVVLEADRPAEMTLEPEEKEVVADGVSTITIRALIKDRFGNPVEGEEVSFTTDLGTMEGEGGNAITDAKGQAEVAISSRQVGTASVKAVNRYKSWIEEILPGGEEKEDALSGIFGQKTSTTHQTARGNALTAGTQIRFIPSNPSTLVLGVDRPTVPADGKTEARIEAELKDEFGNPVEGQKMVFETDLGEIRPSGEVVTDQSGKASVSLASQRVGAASVRARILGEHGLLSATEVVFEAASPAKIVVTRDRRKLTADGEDECLLTAEVEDEMGNPVPEKEVLFETDLGRILPEAPRPADKEGKAEARVSSRIAGTAHVKARCGGVEASVEVEFRPGRASSVAISVNPTLEESWRSRIPSDHWSRLQKAVGRMEERRFADAIAIMEAEEETMKNTCNLPGLCDLAYSYQQYDRKSDAEKLYKYIVGRNGSRKEIRVKADGMEEVFGVVLPGKKGEGEEKDYMDLEPRDYLINAVVTDAHGNEIAGLEVEFEANFGWVPEDHRRGRTNSVGAASSLVTTFSPSGVSELEFAWVNLGHMKENALDYAGAERCYRSALKSMPESIRALKALASVLVKTGEVDMAKRCFYNLARIFSKRGELSRATEYYGKAIELDPKYAKALAGYGAASLRLGEINRAQRYLEESVKLDKSLKAALANLGLLYYLTGKFDKAIPLNRRVLRIDPEYKPALMNLHQIHMAKGEREKAREYATMIKSLGG